MFTVIVIDIVGGSIGVDASGLITLGSHIVSETDASFNPAIQIMSPACTCSTGILLLLSNLNSFVILPFSIIFLSRFKACTFELTLALPCSTLPTKQRPRNGSESNKVASIANGFSKSTFGGET